MKNKKWFNIKLFIIPTFIFILFLLLNPTNTNQNQDQDQGLFDYEQL